MAIGVNKKETKVAIVEEVTEGVAVEPTVGTEFIQILDGFSMEPAKELVERAVLTPVKGKIKNRVSTRSSSGSIPVEWKASGTEGAADLETDLLYRSLLGGKRQITSRITTDTTHTTTLINATAHGLQKGDFIVILEAGNHHMAFVKTTPDLDSFTFVPEATFTPSDGVELAKTTTYNDAGSEPTFTLHGFHGDVVQERAIGSRAASMSLDNFSTGQTVSASFAYEALTFNETLASAPVTPTFDSALPPIALDVKLFRGVDCLDMNELGLSIENTISFLTSVKDANGRISSRITERAVTGTINPYLDDASLTDFNNFLNNSDFELIATLANPSTTTGEIELGSCIAFYLPQCTFTSLTKSDVDDVMTRVGEFQAHAGDTGDLNQVFVGFC